MSDEEERRAYFRACENLERMLLAQIEKLKTEPLSCRELERIKKLNYRNFLEGLRSNEALAISLATTEVQTGWLILILTLIESPKSPLRPSEKRPIEL